MAFAFRFINNHSRSLVRTFRMSTQLRAEEVLEEMKTKNPYFEKYAAKIAALQKTDPEELLSRLETMEKNTKKKNEPEKSRSYSELMNPKGKLKSTSNESKEKSLSDIMKVEMLKDKTVDEIKHIWLEYHKQKDVIVATITPDVFDQQMKRGKEYPLFIVPLPRNTGYEFFLLQYSGKSVHFTPLLCYQVHKENAPECLNMIHYTEFRDQGIILMRGEFDKNVINVQEAQCLANQMQLYYTQNQQSKLNLLEQFTKSPDEFKHEEVIKELENLSL